MKQSTVFLLHITLSLFILGCSELIDDIVVVQVEVPFIILNDAGFVEWMESEDADCREDGFLERADEVVTTCGRKVATTAEAAGYAVSAMF